ncbi:transposase [Nonomuraea sp. NN258]|uniref:transposase n=1 Tax=Nonomuraea antri TaxID=2730852 RepID=UPI0015686419|nr:transposase [Nonomuraea antri]NRQ33915.1 transposase [Nonomuraea antri]
MVMKVYSPELKTDAVALHHSDSDLTTVQASRDRGINPETLRNWLRDDRANGIGTVPTRKTVTGTIPGDKPTLEQLQERIDALESELKAVRRPRCSPREISTDLPDLH